MDAPIASGAAAVLVAYMIALLGIGVWASGRASGSEDDFLLGGRTLGPIVAGLAYGASASSAWVLLGFTGFVASVGVSAVWMIPGIVIGYACVWFWLGPWLNKVSREKGYLTALDVVAGDAQGPMRRILKMVAASMILFAFSFYIAVQFQGAGIAISDVFSLDLTTAVLVGALVILAYTLLGGFWAVSVTDTLQGLSILLIAIVLPIAALIEAGGVTGLISGLSKQPEQFIAPFGANAGWSVVGFLFGMSALGFGAMGQPHLLTWVMAVRDRKARRQGGLVAIGWAFLVFSSMAVVGLAARTTIESGAGIGEGVIFSLAQQTLPGLLPALVYAAILSAVMSTVDSQLLVAAAAGSHDLGLSKLAPGRDVLITRMMIAALCIGAVALTLYLPASIFDRAIFAWTALGSAFGPTIIARMLGRSLHPIVILAAMIAAFTLTICFNQFFDAGPGNWKERGLPWIVGLSIVFAFSKRRRHS